MAIPSPQWALLTGILLSFFFSKQDRPQFYFKLWGSRLLQLSVILLGASLNFNLVMKQGANGALVTFISITAIILTGLLGIKWLKLDQNQGLLITVGTAICGGSAIAAIAPLIAADTMAITVSFGVVFLLNALSVFLFPVLGEILNLSQADFGLWSALAIHDTSSVVAASSIYGQEALSVATTVKLTRALWIIPMTVIFSFYFAKNTRKKVSFPWFILGFLLMSVIFTFFESIKSYQGHFFDLSKMGFVLTLFLIGLTFNFKAIKNVGPKPMFFGVGLWAAVVITSALYIKW